MDGRVPASAQQIEAPLLELREVTKSFAGIVAVKGVSFELTKAQLVGLIGPNGSGKTVTVNLLTGVYPPDSGLIRFHGVPLDGRRPWEINRLGISRTFQTIRLWGKMTVLENVMTGYGRFMRASFTESVLRTPRARREESKARAAALQALELVGMAKFARKLAEDLSLGQQRLVELARALVSQPSCVLLDEPAAGLRGELIVQLGRFLTWLAQEQDIASLIIEHRIQLVMQFCSRVIVLNYGEKIAEGTPSEIRDDPRVVAAYLGKRRGDYGQNREPPA